MNFIQRIAAAVSSKALKASEPAIRSAVVLTLDELVRQIPTLATAADGEVSVEVEIPAQVLQFKVRVK